MIVQNRRHIAKTISYRLISTGIGFLIVWMASGSTKVGVTFSIAELVYKPIQYYLHERFYYKFVTFGLKKEDDVSKKSIY